MPGARRGRLLPAVRRLRRDGDLTLATDLRVDGPRPPPFRPPTAAVATALRRPADAGRARAGEEAQLRSRSQGRRVHPPEPYLGARGPSSRSATATSRSCTCTDRAGTVRPTLSGNARRRIGFAATSPPAGRYRLFLALFEHEGRVHTRGSHRRRYPWSPHTASRARRAADPPHVPARRARRTVSQRKLNLARGVSGFVNYSTGQRSLVEFDACARWPRAARGRPSRRRYQPCCRPRRAAIDGAATGDDGDAPRRCGSACGVAGAIYFVPCARAR
jgi:hypothetical protein